jgi:glycosyltransferase family protein
MKSLMDRVTIQLKLIGNSVQELYAKYFFGAPQIMSVSQTIDLIVERRSSISRFGDGEMDIMRGKSLLFQDFNIELAQKLRQVLDVDQKGLLIGLPCVFGDLSNMNDHARWFYGRYLPENRLAWYQSINPNRVYANAFISRFYIDWIDKTKARETVASLRRMWNNRDIIFIEGEESRLGVGNDLFQNARSIRRVIGPKRNAFARYGEIIELASGFDRSNLIIAALGPTATVLAHDLHFKGFQVLDLGHIDIEYEWLCMGATSKVPVKNKYVNEAGGGADVGDLNDEKYQSEIIARFT